VQLVGAALVAAGASIVAGGPDAVGEPVHLGFAAMYIVSMLFSAAGSIVKEAIFVRAHEQLGGTPVNVFVVNSSSSLCQVRPGPQPLLSH
jgi:hypothetical protein